MAHSILIEENKSIGIIDGYLIFYGLILIFDKLGVRVWFCKIVAGLVGKVGKVGVDWFIGPEG